MNLFFRIPALVVGEHKLQVALLKRQLIRILRNVQYRLLAYAIYCRTLTVLMKLYIMISSFGYFWFHRFFVPTKYCSPLPGLSTSESKFYISDLLLVLVRDTDTHKISPSAKSMDIMCCVNYDAY